MRIAGRKFAITGAGRGLGAALAASLAKAGSTPILLARNLGALQATAKQIETGSGARIATYECDLSNMESCKATGEKLSSDHPDLDGIIHNGTMWLPGPMEDVSDEDIRQCIASAAIGSQILTRHILPVLKNRPEADIHMVVSTSGLANAPLNGTSTAFRSAKGGARRICARPCRGTQIHKCQGNCDLSRKHQGSSCR